MARAMGHINGRDCRHVPGDVVGHEILNLDFSGKWVGSFIRALPTDALVFLCWGRVFTPPVSRVNPSSFRDKPRLVLCALWWSWYLHPVSRTNPRSSSNKHRLAYAP